MPAKKGRPWALDRALAMSRLLDERFYAKFAKALREDDKTVFKNVCKEAGVNLSDVDSMWTELKAAERADKAVVVAGGGSGPDW